MNCDLSLVTNTSPLVNPGVKLLDPNDPQALRQILDSLADQLHTEGYSSKLCAAYRDMSIACIKAEFNNPSKLSVERRVKWEAVMDIIANEHSPQLLDERNRKGCSHVHFATALLSLVELRLLQNQHSFFTHTILPRFRGLLNSYMNVAAVINALKHLSPTLEYASILENFLSQGGLGNIKNEQEILFPLGYLAPESKRGHLLLGKLRYTSQQDVSQVQLFNALATVLDKPVGQFGSNAKIVKVFQLATSFTVEKQSPPMEALRHVCSILPFQIPAYVGQKMSENKMDEDALHSAAISNIYKVMCSKGIFADKTLSPLSTVQYIEGNICVPTAFRMLIYSIAKEEAEKARICTDGHLELKQQCDMLFKQLKDHITAFLQ